MTRPFDRILGLVALVAGAGGLSLAAAPAPASAATTVSSNWAGYAATGHAGGFRRVSGSWSVPTAGCTRGSAAYSASWVGLGGFDRTSQSLEQTGTEVDCNARGAASYSAWFELVPATARAIRMRVRPGDTIAASVEVRGKRVTLRLRNRTSGASFATTKRMAAPDVSSAEWILEAPSGCDSSGRCDILPLTNFGTTGFANAFATTPAGHRGAISDPSWTTVRLQLSQAALARQPGFASAASAAGATPSGLSSGGSAFSVTYQQQAASSQPATTFPGFARRPAP